MKTIEEHFKTYPKQEELNYIERNKGRIVHINPDLFGGYTALVVLHKKTKKTKNDYKN